MCERRDIYRLDVATLPGLERWGEKSAHNVVAASKKSKTPTLAVSVYALGFRESREESPKFSRSTFVGLDAFARCRLGRSSPKRKRKSRKRMLREKDGRGAVPPVLEGIGPELKWRAEEVFLAGA